MRGLGEYVDPPFAYLGGVVSYLGRILMILAKTYYDLCERRSTPKPDATCLRASVDEWSQARLKKIRKWKKLLKSIRSLLDRLCLNQLLRRERVQDANPKVSSVDLPQSWV